MDSLDFLDEPQPETPAPPAPAAALAAPRAAAVPKPAPIHQPTAEDHSKALSSALAREMARRRWARAEAVEVALAGQRDALDWLEAQSFARRSLALATGERARLQGGIEVLEAAHKQAMAREAGLAKALQADPITAALIAEEAEVGALARADQKADAARILNERAAKADAQREQALAREREAQAQREAEQDMDKDEPRPRKKSGGPAAPKPL